jgi:hypothetical protein
MLLYIIPCPISFEYLLIYDDVLYPTFQASCMARGLLESDEEWYTCLMEAGLIQSGQQLRQLFTSILLANSPADPYLLFQQHIIDLSDDYRHRLFVLTHNRHPTQDEITSLALQYIQILLDKAGKTLDDYSLPESSHPLPQLNPITRILAEELDYDIISLQGKWQRDYPKVNI